MASRNGRAATKQAERLARGNYGEQVTQQLGDGRMINRAFIYRSIGQFNPEFVPLYRLYQMREDHMIKLALHYIVAPLIKADYEIQCEDPRIAAGMTEIYKNVHVPWMKTALNMMPFGYQGCIKQYNLGEIHGQYEDPKSGTMRTIWPDRNVQPVVLGTPIPLPPDTTRAHVENGEFQGIETPLIEATDSKIVPREFCLWFANEFEEQFRNYYGTPRIKPAYRAWWSYWFVYHHRDHHAESDADPALMVSYPPGTFPDPADTTYVEEGRPQRRKSNKEAAQEIGNDLRNGATIVWPSDVFTDEQGRQTPTPLWKGEFLKGGENLSAFNALLMDLEMAKLRGCLVPTDALQQMPGGPSSKNVAGEAIDIFTESLEQTASQMDALQNRYQLNEIAKANWGEDCPEVTKVTTGFQSDDMELPTDLIKLAFTVDPNALPINFEELVKRAGLPTYTKAEQDKRQKEAAQLQQEQQPEPAVTGDQVGAMPGENVPPTPQVGAASPTALAASQDSRRTAPKPYEREHIYLTTVVPDKALQWARKEAERRASNIAALAPRLQRVVRSRYHALFQQAADAVASESGIEMAVAPQIAAFVSRVIDKIKGWIDSYLNASTEPLVGELAGMYHAAGLAELSRLGLATESWDVGRDDVQAWARERAGELIKTMDRTVVEQHLRPWLETALSQAGWGASEQEARGIPRDTMVLAQEMTERFAGYPEWMAERVVRTEARRGYNAAAADIWDRAGVQEVDEYDGLGGRTGKTDAECLARNGRRVSLDQFRQDNEEEHPNGTLGAVPVTDDVNLVPLNEGVVLSHPLTSDGVYAVTRDGFILPEEDAEELAASMPAGMHAMDKRIGWLRRTVRRVAAA